MTQRNHRSLFQALLLVSALGLAACGPGHEHFEEGEFNPTNVVDEDVGNEELGESESALSRPTLRLPFRCGTTWRAATFSGHSPALAVDLNRDGDYGDAVLASAAGTVTRAEHEGNTSYGLWVEIAHANGWRTRYAHLSMKTVSVGSRVSQGEKIGEVGNSGESSSSHLHYEQRLNGITQRITFGLNTYLRYYGVAYITSRNGC
jgi:murein DD-endopeptidase MepM/ murein hydrolase activator NlpD